MWRQLTLVLVLVLSTSVIRVPVDGKDDNTTAIQPTPAADKKQDGFYLSDHGNVDSYLIPPDPHRPEEVLPGLSVTPATYLLPPSPEKQIDYYAPIETGEQSDWYPIAQSPSPSTQVSLLPPMQPETIPIIISDNPSYELTPNVRGGKAYQGSRLAQLPSRQLVPPLENVQDDYIITVPSPELELPSEEVDQPFKTPPIVNLSQQRFRKLIPKKNSPHISPAEPTLTLHLTPPKRLSPKYKNPTKKYPKKVTKGFHPIPIPIAQFSAESFHDIPQAKPIRLLKPISSVESEYVTPDEKKIYLYEQAEQKRKLQLENEAAKQQQLADAVEDAYGDKAPAVEQETSETNYRHPGRNVYPAPLRQARPPAPVTEQSHAPPAPSERTEFRMHGMKGPHSYQFGFDTGKGKNRQFRYEERDNEGRVKGHYGYVDKLGKMRVVNYDADPEHGFHAEAPVEEGSQ